MCSAPPALALSTVSSNRLRVISLFLPRPAMACSPFRAVGGLHALWGLFRSIVGACGGTVTVALISHLSSPNFPGVGGRRLLPLLAWGRPDQMSGVAERGMYVGRRSSASRYAVGGAHGLVIRSQARRYLLTFYDRSHRGAGLAALPDSRRSLPSQSSFFRTTRSVLASRTRGSIRRRS